jgi:DNA adenine methylase
MGLAHERLRSVTIENKPYATIIERHDTPDTFFYIDPPYWDCEDYYRLRDQLVCTQAKWMVSLNDVPEIRQIFKGAIFKQVHTTYTMGVIAGHKPKKIDEILILNFDPETGEKLQLCIQDS